MSAGTSCIMVVLSKSLPLCKSVFEKFWKLNDFILQNCFHHEMRLLSPGSLVTPVFCFLFLPLSPPNVVALLYVFDIMRYNLMSYSS